MIETYATRAEYEAATLPTDESTVARIEATNEVLVNGVMVVTTAPQKGDIAVYDDEKNVRFITFDSFDLAKMPTGWAVIGFVEWARGRKVKVDYVLPANYKWAAYFLWNVTGYNTDGAEHPFSFAVTVSSVVYTCEGNYSGTTVAEIAASMDAIVKAFNFGGQTYRVIERDGHLILVHTSYASYLAVTATGVSVTQYVAPEVPASSASVRYNGARTGEGAVINLDRALIYFRQDLSSTTYNPNTQVTSISRGYPVCLPAYLGTSSYRKDGQTQLDYCSVLRAYYGEGEEGWIRFMKDMLVIYPCKMGVFNEAIYGDGKTNTYKLAGQRLTIDGVDNVLYPIFDAAAAFGFAGVKGFEPGDWYLPTIGEIFELKRDIKYPAIYKEGVGSVSNAVADADILTRACDKLSMTQISNSVFAWSSSRYGTYGSWVFNGGNGYAYVGNFYGAYQAVLAALFTLPEAAD